MGPVLVILLISTGWLAAGVLTTGFSTGAAAGLGVAGAGVTAGVTGLAAGFGAAAGMGATAGVTGVSG